MTALSRFSPLLLFWAYQFLFLGSAEAFSPAAVKAPLSRSKSSSRLFMFDFPKVFESFLPKSSPALPNETIQKRQELKAALLEACQTTKSTNKAQQRQDIEVIMDELRQVCPTSPATAASPLLQKEWALAWTTEKEINFFLDVGFSTEIGQTIEGDKLDNNIEFVKGGGFYVSGKLSIPDDTGPRTNFEFETAKLDLGKWGKFEFPPVGAGWFDTIYLDETLRVDVNSRDDILICTPYN